MTHTTKECCEKCHYETTYVEQVGDERATTGKVSTCRGEFCPCHSPTPKDTTEKFEDYLKDVCFEANPTVLDDDMPDFFDDWIESQEAEDFIRLADQYASRTRLEAQREERVVQQELYEALQMMWNQYCPEPLTHEYMTAGENCEEVLQKYAHLARHSLDVTNKE